MCFALSASQHPALSSFKHRFLHVNMPSPAPVLPFPHGTGRLMAPNCLSYLALVIEHPPHHQTSVLFWARGGCTRRAGIYRNAGPGARGGVGATCLRAAPPPRRPRIASASLLGEAGAASPEHHGTAARARGARGTPPPGGGGGLSTGTGSGPSPRGQRPRPRPRPRLRLHQPPWVTKATQPGAYLHACGVCSELTE
jgi:hypothetical protein